MIIVGKSQNVRVKHECAALAAFGSIERSPSEYIFLPCKRSPFFFDNTHSQLKHHIELIISHCAEAIAL